MFRFTLNGSSSHCCSPDETKIKSAESPILIAHWLETPIEIDPWCKIFSFPVRSSRGNVVVVVVLIEIDRLGSVHIIQIISCLAGFAIRYLRYPFAVTLYFLCYICDNWCVLSACAMCMHKISQILCMNVSACIRLIVPRNKNFAKGKESCSNCLKT